MSEDERPRSTKEAAIAMLLGDVANLFDRADEIGRTLGSAVGDFREDVATLGGVVTKLEKSLSNTLDHVTYLHDKTKELANAAAAPAAPSPATNAGTGHVSAVKLLAAAILGGAVVAAASVGAAAFFFQTTFENARVGKAVNDALPYIDPATKKKLEDAMQKAHS